MKKIKIFSFVLVVFIGFLFGMLKINAASASINISNSRTSMVVGNTFKTTVTVSSAAPLGAWSFDLRYDTSKLQLVSSSFGGAYIADVYKNANQKTATYTFDFKAIASGNASINVRNYKVLGYDEAEMSVSTQDRTVKIMTQSELEATYSKNNYLKTLEVEGVQLSPTFNKDILEYTVELEPETTGINIIATKEDGKATVKGAGNIELTEGINKINIIVTAENGNERIYVINAIVKELSPINVEIDGKNYTIIRKKDQLEIPSVYEETTVIINEEEIPAFTSSITKFTLIALKAENGDINYYIYDADKENYKLYREFTFNRGILYIDEIPNNLKIPNGFKKYETEINNEKVEVYKISSGSEFALMYGMNVETGNSGWYLYDVKEKTIQRYFDGDVLVKDKTIELYFYIIIGLSSILLIILIITIIVLVKNNKKGKKKLEQLMDM